MSFNNVYISLSCFIGNRFVEIKRSRSILKKKWKAFKRTTYFKIGSRVQEKAKQKCQRFQEKLNKRVGRADNMFEKFYSLGGEYQISDDLVVI